MKNIPSVGTHNKKNIPSAGTNNKKNIPSAGTHNKKNIPSAGMHGQNISHGSMHVQKMPQKNGEEQEWWVDNDQFLAS